ncbi:MAG TPA: phospho-N-acetylmuramoyl-pentapeptide-transferase [Candidatus Limiplasma sp.]|nr:phospho-N-acetylmuramoyl-pentapeptide-transferase [Candidatus Limiplasma sp.]HRX09696.1 phospho-N-acetylmuramoyl-pentapeptide-transferase [Candidatus Limiplasma sp.]
MFLSVLILLLSVLCTLLIARFFLPMLRRLKFGQPIHELALESQKAKQGTPTMGGLMFAAVTSVLTVLFSAIRGFSTDTLILIIFSLLAMAIGFADDFTKIKRQHNRGLLWWQKVIGQIAIGFLFTLYCYLSPNIGSTIMIPYTNLSWDLGVWYLPVMTLVVMFVINSANLLDGMDGLLTSTSAITSIAWAAITMFMLMTSASARMNDLHGLLFFCLALAGSLFAFLRYNYHPAKVFMGDTGSMFLGAAMAGLALLLRQPLLLVLIAFTMIMSSISVIMQRIYFKLTHGRRIFLVSPIHYHFEKKGMTEPQIVAMYSAIESILAVLAVLSLPWL